MQGFDIQDVPIIVQVEDCLIHREDSTLCSKRMCKFHDWQPTIIIGYYQCTQCNALAACHACVSKVRGRAMVGLCCTHQHQNTSDIAQQEVLE